MLTSDQIMPAVSSLTELYSRPKTSFKVATKNQKVGLVLRKKIATAIVNLIKNGADERTWGRLYSLRWVLRFLT